MDLCLAFSKIRHHEEFFFCLQYQYLNLYACDIYHNRRETHKEEYQEGYSYSNEINWMNMCIIILENQERTLSFLAAKSTIKDSKYVIFDIKSDDIACNYTL